ncbi:MAG TPA: head-tail connector protein [Bacteroidales bacterium]|nr:head-tail connector protein [Bacteroidales bacterium]
MLQEVKEYLKITWDDEDSYIQGIINRGIDYLNNLTGIELDFEGEGQPKALLLDYCRYAYNNALEYFEENFHKEIRRLILQEAVKKNAREEG